MSEQQNEPSTPLERVCLEAIEAYCTMGQATLETANRAIDILAGAYQRHAADLDGLLKSIDDDGDD